MNQQYTLNHCLKASSAIISITQAVLCIFNETHMPLDRERENGFNVFELAMYAN